MLHSHDTLPLLITDLLLQCRNPMYLFQTPVFTSLSLGSATPCLVSAGYGRKSHHRDTNVILVGWGEEMNGQLWRGHEPRRELLSV